MNVLRVLIIADDHFARGGLAAILDTWDEIVLVASMESSNDIEQVVHTYQPNVILWDLGWELAESVKRLSAYAGDQSQEQGGTQGSRPVLALVAEIEDAVTVRDAGASGILLRSAQPEELVHSLRTVNLGLLVLDPEFEPYLFSSATAVNDPLIEQLTPRELEILQGIAEGLTNRAIARKLDISDHTVKFHTTAIFGKLGVSSRTEAVVRATRAGLLLL